MSTLDVVAEVLREVAPRALKAREIAARAGVRLPTTSRTPQTVVSRDLAIDVRDRGASSRFLRVDRGAFVLKEALPTAFYSDIDPYASAWIRNLITAGELAPGVVDERSIRDLKPADVASYRQFHAFSGIGVWSRALRDAGWPDDVNVFTGSCPCQPWSSAGKRKGHADDRDLWPEWFRLIAACRPAIVIGEQVASKDGLAWLDTLFADLEGADYSCRAFDLPAASVGAPHRRQRIYFMAYARERGREILSAPWLHDQGQRRYTRVVDEARSLSDAASARRVLPEDTGADRGDARARAETHERRSAGDLEPERSGPDDGASDFGGEAGGASCGCLGAVGLGDASGSRSGGNPGALPREEGAGAGERIEAGNLAHEPVAPGADDGGVARGVSAEVEVVRGAAGAAGDGSDGARSFRPGDRVRIDGDPSWGGAVRGYWAVDVEWIYCRPEPGHEDGRWRPVVTGIEPLVTGAPGDLGRTRAARLRCYGNSIVLPLATMFVAAVIDAFVDAARAQVTPADPVEIDPAIGTEVNAPAPTPAIVSDTAEGSRLFEEIPGDDLSTPACCANDARGMKAAVKGSVTP